MATSTYLRPLLDEGLLEACSVLHGCTGAVTNHLGEGEAAAQLATLVAGAAGGAEGAGAEAVRAARGGVRGVALGAGAAFATTTAVELFHDNLLAASSAYLPDMAMLI